MENQVMVLVPSKERRILVANPEGKNRNFKKPAQALKWLQEQGDGVTVVSVMGGPGQEFLVRLVDLGIPVYRIPMYRLQETMGVETKASAEERATALLLAWKGVQESFYPMAQTDQTMVLVRELCRQRLSIQEFRKAATLKLHAALRTLEYVLPSETVQLVELLRKGLKDLFRKPELRGQIEKELHRLQTAVQLSDIQQSRILAIRQTFSNPGFILGAKKDEEELEHQITRLLEPFLIWQWLKVESQILPSVKGLGPAVGGATISEIGDIARFPTAEALRAYARFHVKEGGFPRRERGEISSWNRYLNRAVWLWSTDQMPRYDDHPWRQLYDWKKAKELQAHTEAVPREMTDRRGRKRTVWDFTLKHLDVRAKRWVGSQMLNYLFDLWTQVEQGENPELWYPGSSWPTYFARVEQELTAGLREFLEQEIPKRRRREPVEEPEEEEELV